jgi:uncharacterized protein with NAD-binding domain and iron-sulfur cluster
LGAYKKSNTNKRIRRKRYVLSSIPPFAFQKLLPDEYKSAIQFNDLNKIKSSPIISIHLWFDKEFMDIDFVGLIDKNVQWIFNKTHDNTDFRQI